MPSSARSQRLGASDALAPPNTQARTQQRQPLRSTSPLTEPERHRAGSQPQPGGPTAAVGDGSQRRPQRSARRLHAPELTVKQPGERTEPALQCRSPRSPCEMEVVDGSAPYPHLRSGNSSGGLGVRGGGAASSGVCFAVPGGRRSPDTYFISPFSSGAPQPSTTRRGVISGKRGPQRRPFRLTRTQQRQAALGVLMAAAVLLVLVLVLVSLRGRRGSEAPLLLVDDAADDPEGHLVAFDVVVPRSDEDEAREVADGGEEWSMEAAVSLFRLRDGLHGLWQRQAQRHGRQGEGGAALHALSPYSLDAPVFIAAGSQHFFPGPPLPATAPCRPAHEAKSHRSASWVPPADMPRLCSGAPLFLSPLFFPYLFDPRAESDVEQNAGAPSRLMPVPGRGGGGEWPRPDAGGAVTWSVRDLLEGVAAHTAAPSPWQRLSQEAAAPPQQKNVSTTAQELEDEQVAKNAREGKSVGLLPRRRLLGYVSWRSSLHEDLVATTAPSHDRVQLYAVEHHSASVVATASSTPSSSSLEIIYGEEEEGEEADRLTTGPVSALSVEQRLQREEAAEKGLREVGFAVSQRQLHQQLRGRQGFTAAPNKDHTDAGIDADADGDADWVAGSAAQESAAPSAPVSRGSTRSFSLRPLWTSPSIRTSGKFFAAAQQRSAAAEPDTRQTSAPSPPGDAEELEDPFIVSAIAADILGTGRVDMVLQDSNGHLHMIPHARDLPSSSSGSRTGRAVNINDDDDDDDDEGGGVFPILLSVDGRVQIPTPPSAALPSHRRRRGAAASSSSAPRAPRTLSVQLKAAKQPLVTASFLTPSASGRRAANLLYVNSDGALLLLTLHGFGRAPATTTTRTADEEAEAQGEGESATTSSRRAEVFLYNVTSLVPNVAPGRREVLPYSVVEADINADCAPELLYAVRDVERRVLQIYAIVAPPLVRESSSSSSAAEAAAAAQQSNTQGAGRGGYVLTSSLQPWTAQWWESVQPPHPTETTKKSEEEHASSSTSAPASAPISAVTHLLLLELDESIVRYGHPTFTDVDGDGFVDLVLPYCGADGARDEEDPFETPACGHVAGVRVWYNIAQGPTSAPVSESSPSSTSSGEGGAREQRRRDGPAAACLPRLKQHLPVRTADHSRPSSSTAAPPGRQSGPEERAGEAGGADRSPAGSAPLHAPASESTWDEFGFRNDLSAALPLNAITCGLASASASVSASGAGERIDPASDTSKQRNRERDNLAETNPKLSVLLEHLRVPLLLRAGDFNRDGRGDVLLSSNVGPLVLTATAGRRVLNLRSAAAARAGAPGLGDEEDPIVTDGASHDASSSSSLPPFELPFSCAPLDPEKALLLLQLAHLEDTAAHEAYHKESDARRHQEEAKKHNNHWAGFAPFSRRRKVGGEGEGAASPSSFSPSPSPPSPLEQRPLLSAHASHRHTQLSYLAATDTSYRLLQWYRDATPFFISGAQPGQLQVGLTLLRPSCDALHAEPIAPSPSPSPSPSGLVTWLSLYELVDYQHEHYYLLLSAVTPPLQPAAATQAAAASSGLTTPALYGSPAFGVVHHLYWNDKDMRPMEAFATQMPRSNGFAMTSFQVLVGLGRTFSYAHRYMVGSRHYSLAALRQAGAEAGSPHQGNKAAPSDDNHRLAAPSTVLPMALGGRPNKEEEPERGEGQTFAPVVELYTREWPNFFVPNSQVFAILHAKRGTEGGPGDSHSPGSLAAAPYPDAAPCCTTAVSTPGEWSLALYMPVQKYRRRLFIGLLVSLVLIGIPTLYLWLRELQQDMKEWRCR